LQFGNNILKKKCPSEVQSSYMQNIVVIFNADHNDVATSVGLILGACTREMYRPAIHLMTFSGNARDKVYPKLL
jgi:hypothetical protein